MIEINTNIVLRIVALIISVAIVYVPFKLAPDEILSIPEKLDFEDIESGVKSTLLIIIGFGFMLLLISSIWMSIIKFLTAILLVEISYSSNTWIYLSIVGILFAIILFTHHVEVVQKPKITDYKQIED